MKHGYSKKWSRIGTQYSLGTNILGILLYVYLKRPKKKKKKIASFIYSLGCDNMNFKYNYIHVHLGITYWF